jgi:hypothetical protein
VRRPPLPCVLHAATLLSSLSVSCWAAPGTACVDHRSYAVACLWLAAGGVAYAANVGGGGPALRSTVRGFVVQLSGNGVTREDVE